MYNYYKISIDSKDTLNSDSRCIKLMHSTLSNIFENCIDGWKKGDKYPLFKIELPVKGREFVLNTNLNLKQCSFSYQYTAGRVKLTNTVKVKLVGERDECMYKSGDEVEVKGIVSMYKNHQKGTKRSKIGWVRYNYDNMILDKDAFIKKILADTGVFVTDIMVKPHIIPEDMCPNRKQINTAFQIWAMGVVEDPQRTASLEYRSIGQDRGYGFGSLVVHSAQ